MVGRAVHVEGRHTNLQLLDGQFRGDVQRVRVLGKEEASLAEVSRDMFLLHALREQITLQDRPFIERLWFPSPTPPARPPVDVEAVMRLKEFETLNASQCKVAASMISSSEPLVITQGVIRTAVFPRFLLIFHELGPPGTGKTTTIAAAVAYWQSARQSPVWIVAKSNVAVRNIARSLLSNNVTNFKLLVSKEFYFEWSVCVHFFPCYES